PTPVELVAVVAGDDSVTSPLSGARAAVVVVDIVERATPIERGVERVVLGDTLTLRAEGGELAIVARRARFVFIGHDTGGAPLDRAPAEIAFALKRATGSGPLAWREHLIRAHMRVRVRCTVERAGPGRFVARADLARIVVSEILEL